MNSFTPYVLIAPLFWVALGLVGTALDTPRSDPKTGAEAPHAMRAVASSSAARAVRAASVTGADDVPMPAEPCGRAPDDGTD